MSENKTGLEGLKRRLGIDAQVKACEGPASDAVVQTPLEKDQFDQLADEIRALAATYVAETGAWRGQKVPSKKVLKKVPLKIPIQIMGETMIEVPLFIEITLHTSEEEG